jgi:lipopolysaccharide transport system ATP-binding protein
MKIKENPIIQVKHLSKKYRIGMDRSYKTFSESVINLLKSPLKTIKNIRKHNDIFWALKDINFEVNRGEILGIIGRNGSGKTTILKILSRITHPTEGEIILRGRVGSLLEVGTGFHPELTGRENIYFNGAILGMKKQEIENKFDEIVEFSGVKKFLDTPLKRYSSGMQVRLAFSVAAHLEPEILLVDEVLAVGDIEFQKKCLGKMSEVASEGRTVLFVSHNMSAITRLCPRTILLNEGHILQDGPSHQVVNEYLHSDIGATSMRKWTDLSKSPGNDIVRLRAVYVCTKDGKIVEAVDIRKTVGIKIEYEVLKPGYVLVPNYYFFNEEGVNIFIAGDQGRLWRRKTRPIGYYASTVWIPGNFLSEGSVIVGAAISTHVTPPIVHFFERDAVAFQVIDTLEGDSARGDYGGHMPGVVRPLLRWTTEFTPNEI